ncbi:unnamed protein product [Caretta caretta]
MEAAVTLSTGGMSVTLIQRGCRDGHPKAGTEPPAGPSRFLHIQADVRYCLSDQCNAKGLDLGSPGQATAPVPSGPTQRYAGLSLGPQPHTLERVTCDGEDARCYHGNGTLTAAGSWQWPSSCGAARPHPAPCRPAATSAPCSSARLAPAALAATATGRGPWHCSPWASSSPPATSPPGYPATAPSPTPRPGKATNSPGAATARQPRSCPTRTTAWRPTIRTQTTLATTTARTHSTPATRGTRPTAPAPARAQKPGKKNSYPTSTHAHVSQAPGLRLCPLLVVLGIARLGL